MTPAPSSARQLLTVGLWLGLAYGFAEALESCLLGLVPGGLTWQTGNSARVLWVAPIVYGVVGSALGLAAGAMALLTRRVDWTKALVFVALVGGGYFGARLQPRVLTPVSALLLALGMGVQLTRMFARHRAWWLSVVHRTLVPFSALVVLVALVEITATAALEKRALAALPSTEPRPNVLILVADTLRADHLSGYGYGRPTTPHLDRLASEGRLFLDAYADSSWTLPSHASLFTGRRLNEHHAGDPRRLYLDGRFPTLAEVLGRAGYASAGFVANIFWCGRQSGLNRGFMHYEDYYGNVGDAATRTAIGRMMFYQVLPRVGLIDIPGRKNAADINNRVLGWIDSLGGRPFFVFANYLDVHRPNIPPSSHAGRFGAHAFDRETNEVELGGGPDEAHVPDAAVLQARIDAYDESLLYLDEQVGNLFNELARRGLLDRTIVVFTADHGEGFGEHNLVGHGHSLYQDQIRIPLIVRFPPATAGAARDVRPVALDQIPRLVTDMAGLTDSPFPYQSPLGGGASGSENAVVSEVSQRPGFPVTWPVTSTGLRSMQTGQWQLIVSGAGAIELYDLRADPAQVKNLASDSRFADVLSMLQQRLATAVHGSPIAVTETPGVVSVQRAPLQALVRPPAFRPDSAAPTGLP